MAPGANGEAGTTKEETVKMSPESECRPTVGLVALSALLLAGTLPSPAGAQERGRLEVEPRAGVALPVSDLRDVTKFGPSAGLGVSYFFHPRVAFRVDGTASFLDGRRDPTGVELSPVMTIVHLTAGLEFDFPAQQWQDLPLTLKWYLGAGGTRQEAVRSFGDGTVVDLRETYPAATSALTLGYSITPSIQAFASGQVFVDFGERTDTEDFALRSPDVQPFEDTFLVPLTVGVRARVF